jgi:hypothetical protein
MVGVSEYGSANDVIDCFPCFIYGNKICLPQTRAAMDSLQSPAGWAVFSLSCLPIILASRKMLQDVQRSKIRFRNCTSTLLLESTA